MAAWLVWILYILIGFLYVATYSFASFLFSYKIYLVSNDKYYLGSFISGLGLFINFVLYAFVPYIAIGTSHVWLAMVLVVSLGIGAYFSNSVMSKVDLFHSKKNDAKEDE